MTPSRWLAREVAVGAFLAERPGLAVPPSDLLPPGPFERDGLWMTMWQFVAHDEQAPPPEPGELGRSLRELHEALAELSGRPGAAERDPGLARASGRRAASVARLEPAGHRPAQLRARRADARGLRELATRAGASRRCLDREPAAHRRRARLERLRGRVRRPCRVGCRGARGEREGSRARRGVRRRAARRLWRNRTSKDLQPFLEAHALYDFIWQLSAGRAVEGRRAGLD